jgi:hypothetical protein
MRKGQSFIVEFILFFAISFSLFTTISYYFYNQNIYFKERIGKTTTDLVNDIVVTDIITGMSCKSCNDVQITQDLPSQVGGSFYRVQISNKGLNTTLYAEEAFFKQTLIFNINETYTIPGTSEFISENKIIGIQVNNINNIIRFG